MCSIPNTMKRPKRPIAPPPATVIAGCSAVITSERTSPAALTTRVIAVIDSPLSAGALHVISRMAP